MDAKNPSSAISRTSHFPKPQRRNQNEVHARVIANEEVMPPSRQYKVLRSVQYREVTELEVYTLGVDENWRILAFWEKVHFLTGDHLAMSLLMVLFIGLRIIMLLLWSAFTPSILRQKSCKREYLDIWWMKEYGISESWVKQRISMNSIARPGLCNPIYKPIILWNDGEILLQNNCRIEEFNSYNPKDEFLRKVNVYRGSAVVTTYIPQLLLTQDCRG
ncbi:hypothetical protein KY289_031717 [Solanum tuberosum]|nr:hypothetical protein KY289_031717 [Solanum tuberosum]